MAARFMPINPVWFAALSIFLLGALLLGFPSGIAAQVQSAPGHNAGGQHEITPADLQMILQHEEHEPATDADHHEHQEDLERHDGDQEHDHHEAGEAGEPAKPGEHDEHQEHSRRGLGTESGTENLIDRFHSSTHHHQHSLFEEEYYQQAWRYPAKWPGMMIQAGILLAVLLCLLAIRHFQSSRALGGRHLPPPPGDGTDRTGGEA